MSSARARRRRTPAGQSRSTSSSPLENAPALASALDRGANLTFDLSFIKPNERSGAPLSFATLKGQHALLTSYAVNLVSGRAFRAQVTIVAQQTSLVSPTGAMLSSPIPSIAAPSSTLQRRFAAIRFKISR